MSNLLTSIISVGIAFVVLTVIVVLNLAWIYLVVRTIMYALGWT